MPGADHQFAASEDKAATADSADREPTVADQKPVVRAKVVLAAQMHSEAAPTVRYYRPGTELQVVGRADGWFQVSDPVTQDAAGSLRNIFPQLKAPASLRLQWNRLPLSPYQQSRSYKSRRSRSDPQSPGFGLLRSRILWPKGWTRRSAARVWAVYVPPLRKIGAKD